MRSRSYEVDTVLIVLCYIHDVVTGIYFSCIYRNIALPSGTRTLMPRPSELLVIAANSLFLTGSDLSFGTGGDLPSRLVMSVAVVLDMLAAFLPSIGLQAPLPLSEERIPLISAAVLAGVFVWVLFGSCFLFYSPERLGLYHSLVLVIEIVWFIDVMLFMYGACGQDVPFLHSG